MKAYVVKERWKIDTEILVYANSAKEAKAQVQDGEKIRETPELTHTGRARRAPEYDD